MSTALLTCRAALLTAIVLTVIATTEARPAFVVNSTADTVDATPGDDICADASVDCTLRSAVMEATALSGVDTTTLFAGTSTLTTKESSP